MIPIKISVEKEVQELIKKLALNCKVKEFENKVDWDYISRYQPLSEDFIREFQDKVNWISISCYQHLSENFIKEFKEKVDWYCVSYNQHLSEDFIKEFKEKVNWNCISQFQQLSEAFIKEFKEKVNEELYYQINQKLSQQQKLTAIKNYAKKHKLRFDGEFLYAFRNHDKFGRGEFIKTIFYKTGQYYRDWHCDMRKKKANSFGLGIWTKGNTPVKVQVEDWGVEVKRDDGKARVWGFTVI